MISKSGKSRWLLRIITTLLALQITGILLPSLNTLAASTENFVEPAFQQQWQATDQDVAKGKVSRTYFWGPGPFAHTDEVYAESPNNGERHVQYFDKARMELTKKDGQDPNVVTNGLLTVELVTGQMQAGDTTFISRSPATNPVAGDQVNNDQAPTYASFYNGKLAFGVPGAAASADRSGQAVTEAVDRAGQVSTLSQTAAPVKYQRYFSQTGHNLADVFHNFFQAAPLGEAKWLDVMGYPISEPFWAKDRVTVAGQPRDVLIQLFQRRVLTYTPANPAGFQVEMGNIGQHYYVWRYGFNPHDQLPGNYRLVTIEGQSVYSTSIRDPKDKIKIWTASGRITDLHTLNGGWAVVSVVGGLDGSGYLVDLTRPGAVEEFISGPVFTAGSSSDGTWLAVGGFRQLVLYKPIRIGATEIGGTSWMSLGSNLRGSHFNLTFSPDNKYLAASPLDDDMISSKVYTFQLPANNNSNIQPPRKDFDLANTHPGVVHTEWLYGSANSDKLLISYPAANQTHLTPNTGKAFIASALDGSLQPLLSSSTFLDATVNPDGTTLAVLETGDPTDPFSLYTANLSFRSLSNPNQVVGSVYSQGTAGRASDIPTLGRWSADGTLLDVNSRADGTGGAKYRDVNLVSVVSHKTVQENHLNGQPTSIYELTQVGPFYTMNRSYLYGQHPGNPTTQSIVVQNLDGSDKQTLFSASKDSDNTDQQVNSVTIRYAQVVQVPSN